MDISTLVVQVLIQLITVILYSLRKYLKNCVSKDGETETNLSTEKSVRPYGVVPGLVSVGTKSEE